MFVLLILLHYFAKSLPQICTTVGLSLDRTAYKIFLLQMSVCLISPCLYLLIPYVGTLLTLGKAILYVRTVLPLPKH